MLHDNIHAFDKCRVCRCTALSPPARAPRRAPPAHAPTRTRGETRSHGRAIGNYTQQIAPARINTQAFCRGPHIANDGNHSPLNACRSGPPLDVMAASSRLLPASLQLHCAAYRSWRRTTPRRPTGPAAPRAARSPRTPAAAAASPRLPAAPAAHVCAALAIAGTLSDCSLRDGTHANMLRIEHTRYSRAIRRGCTYIHT